MDMENLMKEYEEKRNEHCKALKDRIKLICTVLEASVITTITVNYDGAGDEGFVTEVIFHSQNQVYEGALPEDELSPIINFGRDKEAKIDLREFFEIACCDILPEGWEINDGSYGFLKIDVKQKTVQHEHNTRFTDVVTSLEDFAL